MENLNDNQVQPTDSFTPKISDGVANLSTKLDSKLSKIFEADFEVYADRGSNCFKWDDIKE